MAAVAVIVDEEIELREETDGGWKGLKFEGNPSWTHPLRTGH